MANALRKNCRGLVGAIRLRKVDHTLLAQILRALEREHTRRSDAVLDEELCLELALREVLKEDARADLLRKVLDQGRCGCLVVALTKVLLGDEVVEVDELHVSALTKGFAEGRLAGCLGANDAEDLGEHGLSGILVDLKYVTVSIDSSHLVELLVIVDHWQVLLLVGLEALCDCLSVVVRAALAPVEETISASLLGAVEEEYVLGFADVSLEVGALVDFSREAVDKIVLI